MGKSALISNWFRSIRSRPETRCDDFMFLHYTTSPETSRLSHVLYRLQTAIKERFKLSKLKVRATLRELRMDLPRFLEAASRRSEDLGRASVQGSNGTGSGGRRPLIVIAIDCVSDLIDSAGREVNSKLWLPRRLPRGVKVIVTVNEHTAKASTTRCLRSNRRNNKSSTASTQTSTRMASRTPEAGKSFESKMGEGGPHKVVTKSFKDLKMQRNITWIRLVKLTSAVKQSIFRTYGTATSSTPTTSSADNQEGGGREVDEDGDRCERERRENEKEIRLHPSTMNKLIASEATSNPQYFMMLLLGLEVSKRLGADINALSKDCEDYLECNTMDKVRMKGLVKWIL